MKGYGDDAVALVRRMRGGATAATEAILLVGMDRFARDDEIRHLGAGAILTRPVSPSALYNALAAIVANGRGVPVEPHKGRRQAVRELPVFAARILVAEDNLVNQEVVAGMLDTMGCDVTLASDGRTAEHLFAEQRFDAVLMDCEMPVMDGIEACRRIRRFEQDRQAGAGEAGRRTPIIALTAHAIGEIRERCLEAGMDDFLAKPYDDRQLTEKLARWLAPERSAAAPARTDAPATPPAGGGEVIDGDTIKRLRALDRPGKPSPLIRAVERFRENSPALAATMREQFERGDGDALWRTAHNLKSSAGSLGAMRLSASCQAIEKSAREGMLANIGPLIGGLAAEVDAVIAQLGEIVENADMAG